MNQVKRIAVELSDRAKYGDLIDDAAKVKDPRKWLVESHRLAESFVYDPAILDAIRATPAGRK